MLNACACNPCHPSLHGITHEVHVVWTDLDGRQRKSRATVNGEDVRWWIGRLRIDGRTVISARLVHLGLVGICVSSALDERGDDGVGQNRCTKPYIEHWFGGWVGPRDGLRDVVKCWE
jgi:hypothetical protein